MKALIFLSRRLNDYIQFLVSIMGIIMTIVVVSQVFSRYALNHSLFWSEELARIILVWLTFFGSTVAYYHKLHPGVDTVFKRLPENLKQAMALMSYLAGMVLFTVMVIWGAKFAWFVKLQITPALNLPKWIVMAVVPVCGIIFLIHALAGFCKACNTYDH
ncbi:TRAP transporter small permease [Desulfobacter curvatus]|uniref:TRAP transporter small permease n=1 Tax=Desulfobacter curvatus TaxID=2290 RepID=UPI00037EFC75|nr:TRAP transporter small permease [Desulfobacter curvatus]